MARAKNMVIDGFYKGKQVIVHKNCATVNAGAFNKILLKMYSIKGNLHHCPENTS